MNLRRRTEQDNEEDKLDLLIQELALRDKWRQQEHEQQSFVQQKVTPSSAMHCAPTPTKSITSPISTSSRGNYNKVVLNKRMFISVVDSKAEAMTGKGAIERSGFRNYLLLIMKLLIS